MESKLSQSWRISSIYEWVYISVEFSFYISFVYTPISLPYHDFTRFVIDLLGTTYPMRTGNTQNIASWQFEVELHENTHYVFV